MPNNIATFYVDELSDWTDAIAFYNNEIHDFEKKLSDVISRNSIPHIANKVEVQQSKLNMVTEKFQELQTEMEQQHRLLKTNSSLIDDHLINNETAKRQNELRRKMQAAEREYVDVKFDCYDFLSGTLKKQ
ncbi:hypothetical protein [Ferruginibacter profundus]